MLSMKLVTGFITVNKLAAFANVMYLWSYVFLYIDLNTNVKIDKIKYQTSIKITINNTLSIFIEIKYV